MRRILLVFGVLIASIGIMVAQVTTSTIYGKVVDEKGQPLEAATVVAIHTPSGTQYGTYTANDGSYRIPNMRVGGPYTIETSYIGYEPTVMNDYYLTVGQKKKISIKMSATAIELEGVTVTANRSAILNDDRTGASTSVSRNQLDKLPTISRSAKDFTRLTPSSDGNSFGGRNNKMNNFTLDGSVFNNPFGLDAATPGSQTNAQPVSLDAIDQIQVDIAPYDIKMSGFTGASVNAVTKSGTNTYKGAVFGFFRNQNLTGGKVTGNDILVPDLTHLQSGFSIGGPIIKNKLFFFANAEIERRSDLGTNFVAARPGLTGSNVSRVSAADMERVKTLLKNKYGYETGLYEGYIHRTDNQKGILKLDFNINKNHSLTATYNFMDASRDKPAHPSAIGRRGPDQTTLQFENSGYTINNKIQSGILELKSRFSNTIANNLQVGYTAFRDFRTAKSEPFPTININQAGIRAIVAGFEPFSIHNKLNQDVIQVTNNLDVFLKKHTLTFGASFEKFSFDNSFNLGTYAGVFGPGYASVDAFEDAVNDGSFDALVDAARATAEELKGTGWPNVPDTTGGYKGWALAETNVGQFALYAQDEIALTDNFNLTLGLRVDKPLYFDTPTKVDESISRNCCYDPSIDYYDVDGNKVNFKQNVLPKETPNISPRVSFNWDVNGDRSMQLRGGSGLFSGRFPFVWVGNQVANPNWWFYTTTAENFRFPQVWRTNIGMDKKVGNGYIISADVIYTKDQNAMIVRNYGLKPPTGKLQGVDTRPYYVDTTDRALNPFGGPTNAYVFTNTSLGQTFNISLQVQKSWSKNMFATIGYDFLNSMDASSIPAEISSDAYARNPAIGHVNQAKLSPSLYGHKHRFMGTFSKKFDYAEKWGTTVSTFFEYVKGGRYSYTYSGDINHDGSGANDLIYIPTGAEINHMNFDESQFSAADQRAALEAFIQQDKYLVANRGQYAGKYAQLSPWYSTWDLRILQEYKMADQRKIEFSIDVLNFGNLLSSYWGVRKNPTNTQPIGVSTDADGNVTYSFDPSLVHTYTNDFSLLSRWQAQFGLRFVF